MEKKQYSIWWKNVAYMVQIAGMMILVMSIHLVNALKTKQVFDVSHIGSSDYIQSNYYEELFCTQTDKLLNYLKLRGNFEVDHVYDSDKLIDIFAYANENLLASNAMGNRVNSEAITNNSEDSHAAMQYSSYRLKDLVQWQESGVKWNEGILQEEYPSNAGVTIAEALAAGDISRGQARELYDALSATLYKLEKDIVTYREGRSTFDTKETNLQYFYLENGNFIYGNREVPGNLTKHGEELGSFFYFNGGTVELRSNMEGVKDYYLETTKKNEIGLGSRTTLLVAVDTDFPYSDAFTKGKEEFASLRPWGIPGVLGMIIGLFMVGMSLVYLTRVTGCHSEEEGIRLNWLDRIKTEIFLAIFVAIIYGLVKISVFLRQYTWGIPGMLIMAGTLALTFGSTFLILYLSLVRRIRANNLWEDSFIWWVVKNFRRIVATGKKSFWLTLRYLLYLGGVILSSYLGFAMHKIWAFPLLLGIVGMESIFFLRRVVGQQEIMRGISRITSGELEYKIPTENLHGENQELAMAVNHIGDGLRHAVEDNTINERMKADLITNVSHDLKTPLTSIINYVNLLKMEPMESEKAKGYLKILDDKSQRLKHLTEDLVEASRISSGNIELQMAQINFVELIYQIAGEFNDKFETKDLTVITKLPQEPAKIMADGRRLCRVIENLYNNVAKYAMPHTRVYVTMEKKEGRAVFSIRNISEQELPLKNKQLTDRFTRGDESRSTEGSGLGLSIAQNLTKHMGGDFRLELEKDVFTVFVTFPLSPEG